MANTKYSDCDFSGWATRNDLICGDGRIIKKDAFKDNDGKKVSLVYNHEHNDPNAVLGHAFLENRGDGVYAYGYFNDTESGQTAKKLVQNGDVSSLSIYANKLKQHSLANGCKEVIHGDIKELSLVLAGANPGAHIDFVMAHSDDGDDDDDDVEELYAGYNENIMIHSADTAENNKKEDSKMTDENKKPESEETVADVFNTLNEKQKTVVYAMIGQALEDAGANKDEGDDEDMKHNVFDVEDNYRDDVLTHSDLDQIVELSKTPSIGSFKQARMIYENENKLQHDAFDAETMDMLLPEYKYIDPMEPKILYPDDTWVSSVINGVHKSPYSRIRTRRADARQAELKAMGYQKKGDYKKEMKQIQLLGRTHDAQTVYIKDKINRDDVLDITDFDIVAYQWKIMRHTMDQTLAQAILIGDGREDTDPDKIKEDHIRPIWHDDEMYCIHQDVDIAGQKAKLQGTDTAKSFGDNYVYAEAVIEAALYSREKYKGSGNMTFYCTPHLLNVMLLARDLNGRRIYSSKADLVAALNVRDIQTIEQFEGLTRQTSDGKHKKLLGLFVNLADYQLGCVKGGEITKFDDFDIDFNQYKLLLETRVSGALVEWYSAIALEEPVD